MRGSFLMVGCLWLWVSAAGCSAQAAVEPRAMPRAEQGKAADDDRGRLELKTERAVVFKDGYALVVKRGEAVANAEGAVFTEQVPEGAVLGSFWAWSTEGAAVKAMRAEWKEGFVDETTSSACAGPAEILRLNPGKKVTVEVEGATFTGTVLPLASTPPGELAATAEIGATRAWTEPEVVALEVPERGTVVLAAKDLRRVSGPGLSLDCGKKERTARRTKRLTIELGAGAAQKPAAIHLVYFAPGLRWIPTYRLDVGEKPTDPGTLALQAELLNELEEFAGVAVDLVVGVPNFRFKEQVSPLSLEGVMRNALARAAPSLMGAQSQLSNALFTQRASEWRDPAATPPEGTELPPALEGKSDGMDLHVFAIPSLRLPKGARAVVPLWREQVTLKDVYTLDLDLRRGGGGDDLSYLQAPSPQHRGSHESPLRLARAEIWHQLQLRNPGKTPWTTGAALVMRGHVPQAQELLTYTPSEGKTRLPLTVAVDVRAVHEERELDRQHNALKRNDRTYTRVRRSGSILLSNPRSVATPMEVTLSTGGKVEKAAGASVKLKDADPADFEWAGSVNVHSEVLWGLTLAPGERKTLTYEVSYYR